MSDCRHMPSLSRRLTEHFGFPLYRVEPMLVRIAISQSEPPDWLRGVRRLDQLPRCDARAGGHDVVLEHLPPSLQAARIAWVVENLHDAWHYIPLARVDEMRRLVPVLVLASVRDIVLHRLHWA